MEAKTAKVAGKKQWTDTLYSIFVDADFIAFEPGQFGRIGLTLDGKNIMRPYSFVNAPTQMPHEFYYAIVPEGPLSCRLPNLQTGDDILVAPKPNGYLVLSEVPEARQLWMLATGTAIGPFLSILRSADVWRRFERILLAHAVRYAAELSFGDTIEALVAQGRGQLVYAPFVSREAYPGAMSGRIPQALQSGALSEFAGMEFSPAKAQFMICGNPQMVKDTSAILQAMGFERNRRRQPGHITVENYW